MEIQLSKGCIKEIVQCKTVKDPIVQVLSTVHIPATPEDKVNRSYVVVSDGVLFTKPAPWLGRSPQKLTPNSIVRLDDFCCRKINSYVGKVTLLIINSMTILKNGNIVGRQIGDPKPATAFQIEVCKKSRPNKVKTLPILALNQNNKHWYIKARLVRKGDIQRTDEKFFTMDLTDSSGSITAIAHSDACSKFYYAMKVNKVFLISKFDIQPDDAEARKFKLILNKDSEVVPAIENIKFNFRAFGSEEELVINSTVDVIGVCYNLSDLENYRLVKLERFRKFLNNRYIFCMNS